MPILFTNVRVAPSFDVSSGGMPFMCHAPAPGFALIGVAIRCGMWIDQVTPIFAEMLENGTLGHELPGPSFGGEGGMTHELRCAPGHIVTGLQTRSGSFVDAIRLLQNRWDGNTLVSTDRSWTAWCGGRGGVERPERIAEPFGGTVAVGLAGRAGAYVDNLTLVTAELMKIPATAVGTRTTTTTTRASNAAMV